MKVYCNLCDKVQPVVIDNCRDAKTNEPFQDIVCKECYLVIATGTDIQRTWVDLNDEDIEECFTVTPDLYLKRHIAQRISAKLKEINHVN